MEYIRYEKSGEVGTITIENTKALNTLSLALLKELEQTVLDIRNDNEIGALIITGEGSKAFAAGADLSEMMDFTPQQAKFYSQFGNSVFRMIEKLEMPVIAAVNGYALGGGCELAMSADIRIAAKSALFGQPEAKFGITPGFGGTQRLARIVGKSKAKELIFMCENIGAEQAVKIGLVNAVVAQEALLPTVQAMAQKIAAMPRSAIRNCKCAIDEGFEKTLDEALSIENERFADCFETDDPRRLMSAFLDKRKK